MPTEALESCSESRRPYNETILARIARIATDMEQDGFRKNEALVVWEIGSGKGAVIGGRRRFLSSSVCGMAKVPCVVVKGMSCPTQDDLFAGNMEVCMYESLSASLRYRIS